MTAVLHQGDECSSHPEHPELRLRDRRVERRRKTQRQDTAGFGGCDDAVVPQPRSGVIRITFPVELVADRFFEFFFLFRRPGFSRRFEVVAPHRRKHTCGLFGAHK